MNNRLYIHADDYALTVHNSKQILDCVKQGSLDGISIINNMPHFERCMNMLKTEIPNLPFLPALSVHIDLVEGRSLSLQDSLISRNGLLKLSWKKLFFYSYSPWRRKVKGLLKNEIKKQIETGSNEIRECIDIAKIEGIPCNQKNIWIDFHQHAHAIPVVWDALVEVIKENQYKIEYIRCPKEPFLPFFPDITYLGKYRPINYIKNILLRFYSNKIEQYQKQHNMRLMFMWGLLMSGKMDYTRIKTLFPHVLKHAQTNQRDLELLFHPGDMLAEERCPEINEKDAFKFYASENRKIEKEAVLSVRKELI